MRVVAAKPWAWTLFQDDHGTYLLSSLCGSVAQYGVEIALSDDEVETYRRIGVEAVDSIAQDVARNPNKYKDRAVKDFFTNAEVRNAIDRWREGSR